MFFRCFRPSRLDLSIPDLYFLELILARALVQLEDPGGAPPSRGRTVLAAMNILEEAGCLKEESFLDCGAEGAKAYVEEQADAMFEFLQSAPRDRAHALVGDDFAERALEFGVHLEVFLDRKRQ